MPDNSQAGLIHLGQFPANRFLLVRRHSCILRPRLAVMRLHQMLNQEAALAEDGPLLTLGVKAGGHQKFPLARPSSHLGKLARSKKGVPPNDIQEIGAWETAVMVRFGLGQTVACPAGSVLGQNGCLLEAMDTAR